MKLVITYKKSSKSRLHRYAKWWSENFAVKMLYSNLICWKT